MKSLILCADDYGQNQSISQAIITLLKKNRLSATSCMTTTAHWPDAAKNLLPFQATTDIGLHFNLTEGQPLSPALQRSHGFLPLHRLLLRAYTRRLQMQAIEAELHAQLDCFVAHMQQLPRFIDGHQHVHQLPMVRECILKMYAQRLQGRGIYLRCTVRPYYGSSFKNLVLQLLGARQLKKKLIEEGIPHNASFSGIYDFNQADRYAEWFPKFLRESQSQGIIMCHPGFAEQGDPIAKVRFHEFAYLDSEQFLQDCQRAHVQLGQFTA